MKTIVLSLLAVGVIFGQTPTTTAPTTPQPTTTVTGPMSTTVTSPVQLSGTDVNVSSLPSIAVGSGAVWNRGNSQAVAVDTTLAIRLSPTSNVYSWTDMTTPYVAHNTGAPVASTVTTGLGYVVAQNKSGTVALVAIVQAGVSSSTAGVSPAFTGSLAAAFRLWKTNVYVIPYFKASNPMIGSTGSVASFIAQPGMQAVYTFGGK